ncbi:hypothetical protein Tco_0830697 [Tanacetum coccineum]
MKEPFRWGPHEEFIDEERKVQSIYVLNRPRVYSSYPRREGQVTMPDIRSTNIILQVYQKNYLYTSLIIIHCCKVDIWDNVKMLWKDSNYKEDPVKLNKGLKDSNFDQLYAYLKQHEAHANEKQDELNVSTQRQLILLP